MPRGVDIHQSARLALGANVSRYMEECVCEERGSGVRGIARIWESPRDTRYIDGNLPFEGFVSVGLEHGWLAELRAG